MNYQTLECDTLDALIKNVMQARRDFERDYSGSGIPFFRGHAASYYRLEPSLFRPVDGRPYKDYDEQNFYYEFRARAGALLAPTYSSWDILFLMQHHGVPTRLLDWTESFAAALYFALEKAASDVDIWMLDPYALNQTVNRSAKILDVGSDLDGMEYFDLFINQESRGSRARGNSRRNTQSRSRWKKRKDAIAIYPRRQIARLASQHGLFTLHFSPEPLELLKKPGLTRFTVKAVALEETRMFLRLMGINEFSLFPDLDGLSRFLRNRIKGGYAVVP